MQHFQTNFYDLPLSKTFSEPLSDPFYNITDLQQQFILESEFEIPIPTESSTTPSSSSFIHPNQTKFWKDLNQLFQNSSLIFDWYKNQWNEQRPPPPLLHYWKYIGYLLTGPLFLYFYGTLHSMGELCCLFLVDRPLQILYFLKIRGYLFYLQEAQESYSFWHVVNAVGIVFEMLMILQYFTNRLVMPLIHFSEENSDLKAPWDVFFQNDQFGPIFIKNVIEWIGTHTDDEEEHVQEEEDEEEMEEEFLLENLNELTRLHHQQQLLHRRRRRRVSTKPLKFEKLNQVQLKQLVSDLQSQLSEAMLFLQNKLKKNTEETSKEEFLVSKDCVICLNNVPNVLLKPCCHVCLCSDCAVKTVRKDKGKEGISQSVEISSNAEVEDVDEEVSKWLDTIPTEEDAMFDISDQDAPTQHLDTNGQLYLRSRLRGKCPICRTRISHFSLLSNESIGKFSSPYLDRTSIVSSEEFHKFGILRGIQETSTLLSTFPQLRNKST